jgi:hypothetical protein
MFKLTATGSLAFSIDFDFILFPVIMYSPNFKRICLYLENPVHTQRKYSKKSPGSHLQFHLESFKSQYYENNETCMHSVASIG